jgi:asparagine synthase (glutamine-hydrolysing)
MTKAIAHRGPDDAGFYEAGPIGLGFCRLSIVDLAGGHQPMTNEDGTLHIIFNGEIYNHPQLRPELERRGHRYSTTSDTESILHLYEEHGEDCVLHLRGMFAFAIWDEQKRRLFCARDRLGIKPFYYALVDSRFVFASEIKAFCELPGFRPELNRSILPEFFTFGYTSWDDTFFQGVRKLMPGHRMTVDLAESNPMPRISCYWDLDMTPDESYSSEAGYLERFEELFNESVRIHLMSDVPLGVFLSGGLDSSAIAAVMSRLNKEQIKTFSVGYTEDRYSELPYARLVAKHIGAEYNEIIMGPQAFYDCLPELIWHEDEPIVWPSSVALYFVSKLARQKVKVVLTGEGSDEVFGGYLKYRVMLWNQRYGPAYRKLVPGPVQGLVQNTLASGVLPDWIRRKLRHTFLYYPADFRKIHFDNFYSVFPQDEHSKLFAPELADEVRGTDAYASSLRFFKMDGNGDNLLSRLLYLDIKTYLVELLMKQDQMSMATSIESRVPFLDHKLVEFVARIPAEYKVRFVSGKYLLRRSMQDKLPAEVLNRTKKGFPTPIKPWIRNQLFDRVSSILTDGRTLNRGLLNPTYVRDLVEAHKRGKVDATDACWRLLNFELWHRVFVDRDPALDFAGTMHSASAGSGS